MRILILFVTLFFMPPNGEGHAREDGLDLANLLIEGSGDDRQLVFEKILDGQRTDMIAPMIATMRFMGPLAFDFGAVLDELTGEANGPDWHAWMLWQERHPDVGTFADFDKFKADFLAQIDENFRLFLYPGVQHEIRLEEVAWGGVRKDGIPALNDPTHVNGADAAYLGDDDLVFGVAINGDARAYPLRIMNWHEMFNDIVGGVPVALAYCTLCGSGILYETGSSAQDRIVFGSSGFLYRSNKLMYDHRTHSLWNQFTGEPVVGELTGQKMDLPIRPVVITKWADWRAAHPKTKVLSIDTGYARDYSPGGAYREYFASPELMFPSASADDGRLAAKAYVFVMRNGETAKTWPLNAFGADRIVHDQFAGGDVVLLGDAVSRTVRAYSGNGGRFAVKDGRHLVSDGTEWLVTEDALIAGNGDILERLPGHVAFWFAAAGFLPDGELASP